MLPHEHHEFRLFTEGSVIPPEHRLMLVIFHPECIGDTKKAQWDRGMSLNPLKYLPNFIVLTDLKLIYTKAILANRVVERCDFIGYR